mmetsp:Transcript_2381/g.10889  ORF Transcript_2381/g.10889 Transcript_2381/m.10889 type:complete len:328 (-) Transcript_2381:116-1099(-)
MASMLRRGSRAAASRALALGRAESYHSVAAWRVGGPTALLRGVQPGEDGGFGGKGPVSDHWGGVRGRGVGAFAGIDKPFAVGGAQTRALHASTPSQGKRDGSVSPTVLEDLLKNAQAVGIKEDIDDLMKNNPCHSVSLGEFRTLMADRGVVDANAQDETLEILQKAGVIVKLDDVVYTNPGQLTRDVLAVLPKVPSYVYGVSDTELESLEADLAAQEAEVSAAAGKARWRSNAVVGSGLAFMVTQFVVFLRLTYVELSWDVMEPISYFAGVFNAILVYIYFMVYKRDFSFDDWSSRMQASYTESAISKKGIDFEKYKKIARKLRKVP